ncbi:SCO family protein [bacterium]|nr:SCO family protein [bacterium]
MRHHLLKLLRQLNRAQLLLYWGIFFSSLALFAYDPAESESLNNDLPKQIKDVGITEQLGKNLREISAEFTDETGQKQSLLKWVSPQRPTILSLVYFNCPSLCNLHLNAVLDALKQLSLVAGKDYDLLAVSFDSKETSDLAAAKKYNYQQKYQFPEEGRGIHFLTGDENSVKILADAIGFKYKWDDKAKEWAHASAAVLLTPEGQISRYLHGVYFEPKTFRLSIVEASQGKVGSVVDSIMLFCYRYDPNGSKYALYAFNVMRAAGAVAVIVLFFWLFLFWKPRLKEE